MNGMRRMISKETQVRIMLKITNKLDECGCISERCFFRTRQFILDVLEEELM